ncbi:MAG: amidohydrolase family protein [Proteobacteria bacterium]|nr:amidohydrolase family protein [Pseudomonadota bacterium]MDA0929694.1 amidohydrolase family protein [Pseudomonadota bacterium]
MTSIARNLLLLALSLTSLASQANQGTIAFVGATLIDGTDADPLPNAVLVITDGRVRAVGPRDAVTIPAGADVVDVSGKYLMPGLINAHGHVGATVGLDANGEYSRENLLRQLSLYARYGITTVFSLGGDEDAGFQLRNEQYNPDLDRARLYVAGTVVSGNDESTIRQEVNRNADLGADFIKTRIDDNLGATQKLPKPLFDALVDQAHIRRLPVAVHLFYLEDAKYMLDAGADLIAHSIRDLPVDDEFVAKVREQGVCYIPTLTREVSTFVYEDVPDFFADPYFLKEADADVLAELQTPERMSRRASSRSAQLYKQGLEVALGNVASLHAADVPIAMGTDTGPPARFQGYFEHLELQLMVEAGMSPLDALRSATGVAAQCMGMSDIGTLEPGNWADFNVLGSNPASDILNTKTIEQVYIAGNRVPD